MPSEPAAQDPHRTPDPKHIRALAHPLRVRILDLLAERGPLTATEVSEHVNESPTNCAFHLRTLARYGYVEDAGGGTGRQRPWRHVDRDVFWSPVGADRETRDAIAAAQAVQDEVQRGRRTAWLRRASTAPTAWREAAFEMQFDTTLTPAELTEVSRVLRATVFEVIGRRSGPQDQRARIQLSLLGFPTSEELGEATPVGS